MLLLWGETGRRAQASIRSHSERPSRTGLTQPMSIHCRTLPPCTSVPFDASTAQLVLDCECTAVKCSSGDQAEVAPSGPIRGANSERRPSGGIGAGAGTVLSH